MLFQKFLSTKNDKNKTVAKNIIFSFFIKGFNILVNFLSVPLVLSFLSTTQYGVWLTLTAIIGWFSLFDLGFGNGLRNHLTIAVAKQNYDEGKIYVSTTYAALTVIFGSLIILFLCIYPFINWTAVFNSPPAMADDLNRAVMFALLFLFVQFVLKLINTVLLSFQRSALADLYNAIIQAVILAGLLILKLCHINSLTALSLVYALTPVIILFLLNFYYFNKVYPAIKPSYTFVRKTHVNKLMKLGLNFFVIQIAALVLYASDNFIISHLFSPADVSIYNVAYKYFSITNIIFSIALVPFWSMTTKAYAEHDFGWIKSTINKMLLILLLLILVEFVQLAASNFVYRVWTNGKVAVPFGLSVVIFFYYLIYNYGSVFGNFLNGVGKVKIQLYFSVVGMIINIPLAIAFIKVFHFGVNGVPLATSLTMLGGNLLATVQYKKIMSKNAFGVWNK